jgi:hypothetical protein
MSNDPRVGSFNVLLVSKVPKISTKAHFTLGVKAKVELELIIPIGAINEISPKSFTLGVKAKSTTLCSLLAPTSTLEANVVAKKKLLF